MLNGVPMVGAVEGFIHQQPADGGGARGGRGVQLGDHHHLQLGQERGKFYPAVVIWLSCEVGTCQFEPETDESKVLPSLRQIVWKAANMLVPNKRICPSSQMHYLCHVDANMCSKSYNFDKTYPFIFLLNNFKA